MRGQRVQKGKREIERQTERFVFFLFVWFLNLLVNY